MCGCEASKPVAVCVACGATEEAESFLEMYQKIQEAGWGQLICGGLVCPECLARVAKRQAMMANAHLN